MLVFIPGSMRFGPGGTDWPDGSISPVAHRLKAESTQLDIGHQCMKQYK